VVGERAHNKVKLAFTKFENHILYSRCLVEKEYCNLLLCKLPQVAGHRRKTAATPWWVQKREKVTVTTESQPIKAGSTYGKEKKKIIRKEDGHSLESDCVEQPPALPHLGDKKACFMPAGTPGKANMNNSQSQGSPGISSAASYTSSQRSVTLRQNIKKWLRSSLTLQPAQLPLAAITMTASQPLTGTMLWRLHLSRNDPWAPQMLLNICPTQVEVSLESGKWEF
jgi:hypothetical protein